MLIIIFKI